MPFYRAEGGLHYYAHVPKCGGTAVERHLTARFGALALFDDRHLERLERDRWSRSSPQHIVWEDLLKVVPQDWIASVFTVVRHPLLRAVSAYNYQVAVIKTAPAGLTIDAWFDDYVTHNAAFPFQHDNHMRPQSAFSPPDAAVFKLEEGLDPVAAWLADRFGPGEEAGIPAANDSERSRDGYERREGVSTRLRALVEDVYAEDYRRYGYDPTPPRTPVVRIPTSGTAMDAARLRISANAYRVKRRVKHALRNTFA